MILTILKKIITAKLFNRATFAVIEKKGE